MSNREIESILITENEENLHLLSDVLKVNSHNEIKILFDVIYNKIVSGSVCDTLLILSNLEIIISTFNGLDYKEIIMCNRNLIVKLSKVKFNDSKYFRDISYRLLNINRNINIYLNSKKREIKDKNFDIYYNVIFKKRDIAILTKILRSNRKISKKTGTDGKTLLQYIIEYYLNIDTTNNLEIAYFEEVIKLLYRYEKSDFVNIMTNDKYLNLTNSDYARLSILREKICSTLSLTDKFKLLKEYNIDSFTSPRVIKEMKDFKINMEGRVILPYPFITIDGEDASCLDDALCAHKNSDGSYYFYVAISDVASIVPYDSLTFKDALNRCETLYLSDDTKNMFYTPVMEKLSYLKEGVNRNALVYRFFVDPNFVIDLDSLTIIKGVINVRQNLSFGDVNNNSLKVYDECRLILSYIEEITSYLKSINTDKKNYRNLENFINSKAIYHHSIFTDTKRSASMIEESMLLINSSLASYFSKKGLIYCFRNHNFPSKDGLIDLSNLLIDKNDKVFLERLKKDYLNAYYSLENHGHEGLGYEFYSHSSAPLRRMSDFLNQHLIYMQVFNHISDNMYYEIYSQMKEIVDYINKRKKENTSFTNEYNYLVKRLKK